MRIDHAKTCKILPPNVPWLAAGFITPKGLSPSPTRSEDHSQWQVAEAARANDFGFEVDRSRRIKAGVQS